MSSKLDVSALSMETEEAQSVSEAVVEKVFIQSELNDVHEIQTGIQHDTQIVFIGSLEIGGEALVGCTPAEQGTLEHTEKVWTPKLVTGRFSHCANDLPQLLKLYRKAQRVEPDFYDRIGSEELGMLMSKIIDSLKTSISAKAWLGDTAAAVLGSGGNFTIVGFNAGIWNQFDGLWKQIFADGTVPRYTITENAGNSYTNQELAAGESYNILRNIYEGADPRLLGDTDAQYLVTRSIWDNLLTYIETKEALGGIVTTMTDGRMSLSFRGITVKLQNEWDRTIRKYQDDLTVHFRPHRALLTVPGNIPLGTLSTSDMDSLTSIYDPVGKQNLIDYGYYLDAKHLEAYMSSVAY